MLVSVHPFVFFLIFFPNNTSDNMGTYLVLLQCILFVKKSFSFFNVSLLSKLLIKYILFNFHLSNSVWVLCSALNLGLFILRPTVFCLSDLNSAQVHDSLAQHVVQLWKCSIVMVVQHGSAGGRRRGRGRQRGLRGQEENGSEGASGIAHQVPDDARILLPWHRCWHTVESFLRETMLPP